jgi:4-hydroxy-2-oxoheptanedioate aldolase
VEIPRNTLKAALARGQTQIGCWLSMASPAATEICAGAGYDWLLIDMEHAPNDLPDLHRHLLAASAYPAHPVVRPPVHDPIWIKRLLDIGAQTLLLPMIESAQAAREAVAASRYPPRGSRGVSTNSRANRYGRVDDWFGQADGETCVLVQIESRAGVEALDAIAATDGIDGVFIGPQDLAASYGHLGDPAAPEVQAVMADVVARVRAAGKAAGILAFAEADAKRWIAAGATFVAVTSDQFLLSRESAAVARRFRD